MKVSRTLSIAFCSLALLGGCGGGGGPGNGAERTLTVSGSPDAVAQFMGELREREPVLQSFAIESGPGGEAHGRLAMPKDYDGDDIGRITRAAVAAGLSYEFEAGKRE